MHTQLFDYIKQAREKGLTDEVIRSNLVLAGWDADVATAGLSADLSLPAPPPPNGDSMKTSSLVSHDGGPVAVVSNFTTKGLEYIIMFIAMAVAAISLGLLLHDTVDGLLGQGDTGWTQGLVSYATAGLIVSLPIFLLLFIRLKRAEITDHTLRHDPSRRRAIQLTLIVTFIIGIWKVIRYIYSLLNSGNGTTDYYDEPVTSFTGDLLHLLITLGIAGGIFAYFWFDTHRKGEQ